MVFNTHPPGRVVDFKIKHTKPYRTKRVQKSPPSQPSLTPLFHFPIPSRPPSQTPQPTRPEAGSREGGRTKGGEGRAGDMLCCCCNCWFCRNNSPGIALNFHQVSSRTPEVSMRKSFFLAGLSGAENVSLWRTETVCLWRTETVCLCGTETLSLCGTETLCLCGTETGCLCEEHRIWQGGLPAPPAPPPC